MKRPRIAILDDCQRVALSSADWSGTARRAEIEVFTEPLGSEDEAAAALASFEAIVLMRERTPFPASLISRLPSLRFIALAGTRTNTLDVAACSERRITVSHTTAASSTATAELAFGLIVACARGFRKSFANMASAQWQDGVPLGLPLTGKRLGIVGLGVLGREVARMGLAFRMDVVAWSPNLSDEVACSHGVQRVEKDVLFSTSDVVTLHLALSERTRHVVSRVALDAMKSGSILINTARAGLVDSDALLETLQAGRITAGLDVFDTEPLEPDHPLRSLPNVVLTPHLGYVVKDVFDHYYGDIVASINAWLDGKPIRILNPDGQRAG